MLFQEVRTLLKLAWPVILGQVGLMSMGLVDMVLVGRLGPEPLAALGIGNALGFGTLLVGLGAAHGIDPLVTQAYGAGRPGEAVQALVRGTVMMAFVAAAVTLVHLYAGPLLTWMGQPKELIPTAATYTQILAPSVPLILAFALLRQFLQGSGQMQPAMWAIVIGNGVNLIADYLLIEGNWGAPALGVPGAGWSTSIVRMAMLICLTAFAWPELKRAWPGTEGLISAQSVWNVSWIALPVGAQLALEVWAFTSVTLMSGWIGSLEVAAHQSALSLASTSFMVPLGLSAAASTRVGNLVGAGKSWTRAAVTTQVLACGIMGLAALIFVLFPEPLVRIFLHEPEAIALAASLIPVAAIFQLFDGLQVTSFGILRGLGDTRKPMLANVVGYWLWGLPLGYVLTFHLGWGLQGLWFGLVVALGTVSLMLGARLWWWSRQPLPARTIS